MKKFFDTGMPNVVSNVNQIKISRRYKNNASEFITRNRASMILCIVLLLFGGLVGGAVYTWLPQDLKNQIFSYMQNYFQGSVIIGVSHFEIFKTVIYEHIITAFIIFLSGMFVFLSPLSFIRLCSKGFTIGFSLTFLVSRYGAKGIIFGLLSIIACNALIVTTMVWFTITASETGKTARHGRKLNKLSRDKYTKFIPVGKNLLKLLLSLVIFLAIALVSAPIESFVGPGLLKALYSIFSKFA